MPHSLFLGMTESGKSSLAQKFAGEYKNAGIKTIVLDPMKDPKWQADFITSDPNEFLDVFWGSRSCAVFIDEAGENVGRYDTALIKTATRGRHWGHNVHYLAQRAQLLNATVRGQCSRLFLFNVSKDDAKLLSNEFGCELLKEANSLQRGEYFAADRFNNVKRGKLF